MRGNESFEILIVDDERFNIEVAVAGFFREKSIGLPYQTNLIILRF